jgi:hypothetical protein
MADAKTTAAGIEARLDQSIEKQAKAQRTNIVVGVILLAVVLGYFTVLNFMVRDAVTPDSIAEVAVGYAEEEIPKLTAELRRDVAGRADTLVNQAVDQGLNLLPEVRKQAESFILSETRIHMAKAESEINALTDFAFDNHGEDVRGLIADLSSNEGQIALETELYDMLTALFMESNVKVDIEGYGLTLLHMNDKLLRLRDANDLTEAEKIERDIIVALREFSDRSDAPVAAR